MDCLRRLNMAAAAYMLTGSMASNYWGIPRTTHDIDFVMQLPPSSVSALVKIFTPDFYLDEPAVIAAYQPPYQFNALDTRSNLKVDFWLLKNVPFEREMFSRRQKVSIFGVVAWISSAEDVILHKLYWNKITPSERQLKDAAGIMAVQNESLDLVYMRRWGKEIDISEKLDDILSKKIRPKHT